MVMRIDRKTFTADRTELTKQKSVGLKANHTYRVVSCGQMLWILNADNGTGVEQIQI